MGLEKPFLYVNDTDVESFKEKYINYETEIENKSTKYEDKIVFLGSTGEIAARGQIFGSGEVFIGKVEDAPSNAKIVIDDTDSDNVEIYNKDEIDLLLNDYEKTDNKVTSISNASTDTQYPSAKAVYDYSKSTRLTVSKSNYSSYIGLDTSDPNYDKVIFISDGSGIIYHGQLYINNPYWVKVVDELPTVEETNTLYLVKE